MSFVASIVPKSRGYLLHRMSFTVSKSLALLLRFGPETGPVIASNICEHPAKQKLWDGHNVVIHILTHNFSWWSHLTLQTPKRVCCMELSENKVPQDLMASQFIHDFPF